MWYSFYWEKLFEGTQIFCTWNISIPLQQMLIQGEQSRIFKTAYSLDTWRQGAPMYVVWCHAYFKSNHGKAHWNFTYHGQWTKLKEPPYSSMCIYCVKTNTTKGEVDKHIMCHTREKKIRVWTLSKGIFTVAYTNSYGEKPTNCNIVRNQSQKLSSQKACFKGSHCNQTNPSR